MLQKRETKKQQGPFQRIRNSDPTTRQQTYMRRLLLTSLIVAVAIFGMGIWVGTSFNNLQQQITQSQLIQQTADNEFFTHLTGLQNGLQSLQVRLDNNQFNAATIDEYQVLLDQWIQAQETDVGGLQATLGLLVEGRVAAQGKNVNQFSMIQKTLGDIKNLLIAAFISLVSLVVLLAINSALIAWSDFRTRRELKSLQDEWHEKGIKTGILEATKALDHDPSVLRNIMSWMYNYGNNRSDVDSAFDLFTQLISRFSNLNFYPIGQIGEQVKFDPHRHRHTEFNIHPGDICYIHETGWMLDDEVVRKPLVIRRGL